MKKPPPQAPFKEITAGELAAAVMETDDFGHEMRVGTVLANATSGVQHGGTYKDPFLSKPREFDFRAFISHPAGTRVIRLAIECKNVSKTSPIVIAGTARTAKESVHDFVIWKRDLDGIRTAICHRKNDPRKYKEGQLVGKSVMRFKRDTHDEVVFASKEETDLYDRWNQAISSAHDLCKLVHDGRSFRFQDQLTDTAARHLQTVIIPAFVVPDDVLWSVEYDTSGGIKAAPKQVNEVQFYVNHNVELEDDRQSMDLSHLHFFTLSGLEQFLQKHRLGNDNDTYASMVWDEWF